MGLRAQVGFIHIKDLVVENYTCTGLLHKDYGIQIADFENIRLEYLNIEGNKDGVHLGMGKGFVIRHGRFRTYDDPVALNAFDYSTSNTHVGWIEDGLVEDCYDLPQDSTVGYFCRILGGAWCEWYKGMKVQHSDTVVYNGRIYRVVMDPRDGKLYTSNTPPCHERGTECYDGINWVFTQNGSFLNTGCRNIVIRDIHLQKQRPHGISIDLNRDTYAQSYYPGSKPVPQGDILFENIYVENEIPCLLRSNYPTRDITLRNIDLKNSTIRFESAGFDDLEYPEVQLTLDNVTAKPGQIQSDGKHRIVVNDITKK